MGIKKILGYLLALLPALGSLGVVSLYAFVIPVPDPLPNQTLRGAEIILPVISGVVLALVWFVSAFFQHSEVRQLYFTWSTLAALPFVVLMVYLWVIVPIFM